MAKTKTGAREKTKTSRSSSSKSSGTASSVRSGEKVTASGMGRMRNRRKSGPELYKTRHNIGKRSAAGRVTSYRETEVVLVYPDGFFRPGVKVEMNDNHERRSSVDSDEGNKKTALKREEHMKEEEPAQNTESMKQQQKSASPQGKTKVSKTPAKSVVKKAKSLSKKSSPKSNINDAGTSKKDTKSVQEKTKSNSDSVLCKDTKSAKDRNKHSKDISKNLKNTQTEESQKKTHITVKDSQEDDNLSSLQSRAPRIKRTACLNAGAIMSALYRDIPVAKKPKMEPSSTQVNSEKTVPVTATVVQKHSPKKQEVKKAESPKKLVKKNDKKNELMKSGGKGTKKVAHLDINKKVKVKMKVKEKSKSKIHSIKRKKKVKVEESAEEDSEEEEEEEEHIPLWPPPKRMASLNAQAILAACHEDRIKRPKAVKKPTVKQRSKVQIEKEVSETSETEHQEPAAEKAPSTSKPGEDKEKPDASPKQQEECATPVSSQTAPSVTSSSTEPVPVTAVDRQVPVSGSSAKPNVTNQSPDVQIVEVKPPAFSGAPVSRMNTGSYSSHVVPHHRQTQGPVTFMPSSSSSFSYATPSAHGNHSSQARYAGVPIQQAIPPHVPSGYTVPHQTQRAYQSTHMAYPSQGMIPSQGQHGAQKMYGQGHQPSGGTQHPQGQHVAQAQYAGHPPARHRPPLVSQSPTSFQQQQPQQQPQQGHHHHHQLASYQASLTPHSSQNPVQQSQSYHQSYPIQQAHHRPAMPIVGHHSMSSGSVYPGGTPMAVTKPKLEPRCSTPGQRFQPIGPKPEKPLMTYPTMPGVQGQPGAGHNHPHGSSPMGNTCTYPYPHSNHGNSQSDHCQSYMMSSMPVDNSATCTMMSFRHFGSAFTLHGYDDQQQEHTTFGFYQPAGPLIQTMPHDPCCIPEHMAMLVPRPQVKVLVHNTGSYPATNPYTALPGSSQPPIIPSKPADTQHIRTGSMDLKEKSQRAVSPVKTGKSISEPEKGKAGQSAEEGKESDGKVFTTLEVASKQSKNIDGRELLAQRTKLSSDPLLLQPIISSSSSSSHSTPSEDKSTSQEPSVAVSQTTVLKTSTTDKVLSSAQSQQSDMPIDKPTKGHDKKEAKKDTPKMKCKKKEGKVSEEEQQEDGHPTENTKSTVAGAMATTATVAIAIPATTTVIDTQAKISTDLTTVVTYSTTTTTEPKRSFESNVLTSRSMSTPSTVPASVMVSSQAATSTVSTTSSSAQATSAPTKVTNKKTKSAKDNKKQTAAIPNTISSPCISHVVTTSTAPSKSKAISTDAKEIPRKRKGTNMSEATAVKKPVSTAAAEMPGVASSTAETSNKNKTKTASKSNADKKVKSLPAISTSSTAGSIEAAKSSESSASGLPKTSTTCSAVATHSNVTSSGLPAHTAVSLSTTTVASTIAAELSAAQPAGHITASKTTQCKMTVTGTKQAPATTSTAVATTTVATASAAKQSVSTSSGTQLFVTSTQKPIADAKAGPAAILPQGTMLLSNTGSLNQPILMSAINNPSQLTPGQLPLVSVTTGQVVMPVFLPAKSLAGTSGSLSMASTATSTLSTTPISGSASSQMRMPLIQNSFPVTQANIALSGMMPPVFLSIPQPNTVGQTFLHLGGIKPTLQQIQVPVVSHQQVMVSQAIPDIKMPTSKLSPTKNQASSTVQSKKPSGSSQGRTETKDGKGTPKSRKKKPPKEDTADNKMADTKVKEKTKTPAKKKTAKPKAKPGSDVTAASVISPDKSTQQSTVLPKNSLTAFSMSTVPQVVCSVSQVRSSTAPLLGCSPQPAQSQGRTNISHCTSGTKSQTPLEMLQTVAMNIQHSEMQSKESAGAETATPAGTKSDGTSHKMDQNGALDLVVLSGGSSSKTSKDPVSVKVPASHSRQTDVKTDCSRPVTMLHSPPPISHNVPPFSPGFLSPTSPMLKQPASMSSATAYEDLIQDLSMPRQQHNRTSTTKSASTVKESNNKRDRASPIDLSKNKTSQSASKASKSEGSKKVGTKKSKQASTKRSATKSSLNESMPSCSTSATSSGIPSMLAMPMFQSVSAIQIPVINKLHSFTVASTKPASAMAVIGDASKASNREGQTVSSTTNNKSVGFSDKSKADRSSSAADVEKQADKTTPTKGILSRGFQLSEVVERLHQANKETSDNSDKSDGESPQSKQAKAALSQACRLSSAARITNLHTDLGSKTDTRCQTKESCGEQTVDSSQSSEVSKCCEQEQSSTLMKQDDLQKSVANKRVISSEINIDEDDDDDDDDEDALFIDMDCDPADNKPGISSPVNEDIMREEKLNIITNVSDANGHGHPSEFNSISVPNKDLFKGQPKCTEVDSVFSCDMGLTTGQNQPQRQRFHQIDNMEVCQASVQNARRTEAISDCKFSVIAHSTSEPRLGNDKKQETLLETPLSNKVRSSSAIKTTEEIGDRPDAMLHSVTKPSIEDKGESSHQKTDSISCSVPVNTNQVDTGRTNEVCDQHLSTKGLASSSDRKTEAIVTECNSHCTSNSSCVTAESGTITKKSVRDKLPDNSNTSTEDTRKQPPNDDVDISVGQPSESKTAMKIVVDQFSEDKSSDMEGEPCQEKNSMQSVHVTNVEGTDTQSCQDNTDSQKDCVQLHGVDCTTAQSSGGVDLTDTKKSDADSVKETEALSSVDDKNIKNTNRHPSGKSDSVTDTNVLSCRSAVIVQDATVESFQKDDAKEAKALPLAKDYVQDPKVQSSGDDDVKERNVLLPGNNDNIKGMSLGSDDPGKETKTPSANDDDGVNDTKALLSESEMMKETKVQSPKNDENLADADAILPRNDSNVKDTISPSPEDDVSMKDTKAMSSGNNDNMKHVKEVSSGSDDNMKETKTVSSGNDDNVTDTKEMSSGIDDNVMDTMSSGSDGNMKETKAVSSGNDDNVTDTKEMSSEGGDNMKETKALSSGSSDNMKDTKAVASGDDDNVKATTSSGSDGNMKEIKTASSGNDDNVKAITSSGNDGNMKEIKTASSGNDDNVKAITSSGSDGNMKEIKTASSGNDDNVKAVTSSGSDGNMKEIKTVSSGNDDNVKATTSSGSDDNTKEIKIVSSGNDDNVKATTSSGSDDNTKEIKIVSSGNDDNVKATVSSGSDDNTKEIKIVSSGNDDNVKATVSSGSDSNMKEAKAMSSGNDDDNVTDTKEMSSGSDDKMKETKTVSSGNDDNVTDTMSSGSDDKMKETKAASSVNDDNVKDTKSVSSGNDVNVEDTRRMSSENDDNINVTKGLAPGYDEQVKDAKAVSLGNDDNVKNTKTMSPRSHDNVTDTKVPSTCIEGTDQTSLEKQTVFKNIRVQSLADKGRVSICNAQSLAGEDSIKPTDVQPCTEKNTKNTKAESCTTPGQSGSDDPDASDRTGQTVTCSASNTQTNCCSEAREGATTEKGVTVSTEITKGQCLSIDIALEPEQDKTKDVKCSLKDDQDDQMECSFTEKIPEKGSTGASLNLMTSESCSDKDVKSLSKSKVDQIASVLEDTTGKEQSEKKDDFSCLQQDLKAKQIIMAIDSLVNVNASVGEFEPSKCDDVCAVENVSDVDQVDGVSSERSNSDKITTAVMDSVEETDFRTLVNDRNTTDSEPAECIRNTEVEDNSEIMDKCDNDKCFQKGTKTILGGINNGKSGEERRKNDAERCKGLELEDVQHHDRQPEEATKTSPFRDGISGNMQTALIDLNVRNQSMGEATDIKEVENLEIGNWMTEKLSSTGETGLPVTEELKIICEDTDLLDRPLVSGACLLPVESTNKASTSLDTDQPPQKSNTADWSPARPVQLDGTDSIKTNAAEQVPSSTPGTSSTGENPGNNPHQFSPGKQNSAKKSPNENPRRTSPRTLVTVASKKEDLSTVADDNPKKNQPTGSKRKDEMVGGSPPMKRALISPKRKDDKKVPSEQKKSSPNTRKKEDKLYKPWKWEGEPEVKPVYTQVEGPPVLMTCYPAIRHDDGDLIRVRDCVLVKSGPRKSDIPYVAKIGALFEDRDTREIMMSVLWFYRAEHTETERLPRYIDSEIFASRHRDIIPAVCIDDKCYVLTFNEFCRYHAEQTRIQQCLPPRPNIVPPLDSSELIRSTNHTPPLTASNETVFLCRRVYDVKLKRILKNPQVHVASHSGQ